MRKVRYAVACSLDGYIAGPDHEADWIIMDPEIDFEAIFARFDTLLVGRRTFAAMAQARSGDRLFGKETVVFSRTLDPADHPGVTILEEGGEEVVREMKATAGKDIWLFGGGELFRSLLAAGVVDAVELAVIPVLLGGGIPMLPAPANRAELTLAGHRVYGTGIVALDYEITATTG